jgi:hypothetical protein
MAGDPPLEFQPDDAAPPPQVFVRTFAVPPGAPWTQARAAQLEARHGAPLPLPDLMHRLRRQGGWTPGQAGQYAAFYIRRSDYRMPFETLVDVDGRAHRVSFGAKAQDLSRVRTLILAGVALAGLALLLAWAGLSALEARSDAANRLDALSHQVATRLRQGRQAEARSQTAAALARAQGQAAPAGAVIDDLDWLAHARAPESQILAVHWDHGLMAVESRGETPPVAGTDRELVRSAHPVRPGVWLWGIRRRGPANAQFDDGGRR